MLKVALDIHRIFLMLKNKIYKYLSIVIFKNFITILLTFTAIAWTVRAVNFLDLMVNDGFSASVYFKYSLLNISTIATRFVPLSFLLSLILSVTKFERDQELMIIWTVGINKIRIANIFFILGFFLTMIQIFLGLIINPLSLNKSRSLLREVETKQVNSILRSNDFSDTFKGVTFYIDERKANNELINIFIKDTNGSLDTIVSEIDKSKDTTIFTKRGFIFNNKLILFQGTIQTQDENRTIKNINFEKTELVLASFSSRTITQPKIQETSSFELISCLTNKKLDKILHNCTNKSTVVETLARRIGMPLYIPLISVITSFLLIYKKEKKFNYLKKYIIFSFAFIILIFAEILLKFSGFSLINLMLYSISPIILLLILYTFLIKNMSYRKST